MAAMETLLERAVNGPSSLSWHLMALYWLRFLPLITFGTQ